MQKRFRGAAHGDHPHHRQHRRPRPRRWPKVLSNAVDPGWVRTKMGGASAPVDLATGQRTQTWLAVSGDAAALVSGRYWHHLEQQPPARQATDPTFQDELIEKLGRLTGVELPQSGMVLG